MALVDPSTSILEDGVFFVKDPDIGASVDEFEKKGFPYQTEGIDLYQKTVLDNARIRDVIESFFEWSGFGLLKTIGENPDLVFTFLNNTAEKKPDGGYGGKENVKALIVQLFPSKSRVLFYKRSHLHALRAKEAKIGFLDVPKESLARDGIEPNEVNMEQGGFAIIDARFASKILLRFTIIAGFAVQEELKFWSKMKLPNNPDLVRKVAEMESKKIGMNVEFIDTGFEQSKNVESTKQPA